MDACTFFGHRDTLASAEPFLHAVLIDLIETKSVRLFYVGCQGNFDLMAQRQLNLLSCSYDIQFYIVQAYLPQKSGVEHSITNSIFPEGLECVPRRFAICKRNLWMIERCRYVVTYIRYCTGNAEKMKQLAIRKGKTIISI